MNTFKTKIKLGLPLTKKDYAQTILFDNYDDERMLNALIRTFRGKINE